MLKKIERIYDEKVIKWFYTLLPLVEVLTTYMVVNMNTAVTAGVIYKTMFLLYALFYLVFINKSKRKSTFVLLGILAISVITNLLTTVESYSVSNIITKASELCKYMTFPITMLFFYKYIENGNKIHLKTLVYSATIYATVMLIAAITGTQHPTYETVPEYGHSGWYYSGNEISALLAMFYPIIIYFAGKYKTKSMLFSLCVVTYGLLAIGTKTSFFAIAIIIGAIVIFEFVMYLTTKNKLSKDMLFTVFILLVVLIASAPYSPSLKYMQERFLKAENSINKGDDELENNRLIFQSFVYNGRELDMKEQIEKYKNSNNFEKIFGLKNENRIQNSAGKINMIERDIYDIFFAFGIAGTIIYFFPIIFVGISFAKRLLTNFKEECNEKNFVIGLSSVVVLGISYIAGHVLLAPTVVLFFSVLLAKLNMKGDFYYLDENKGKKEIAIFIPRLSIGGMEKALINLLNMSELKEKYDIKLYIGYIKDKEYALEIPSKIDTHVFCRGKWILPNKIITVIKMLVLNIYFIFKSKYYASICYGHNHGILALLARSSSKNNIIFVHADLANRSKKEITKLNRSVKFEKFKRVVCVSNKAKESYQKLFNNLDVRVINNYIDGKKILEGAEENIEDLKLFDGKITTFVNVSRHNEKSKRLLRIINAASKLKQEKYKFKILFIGNGQDTEMYIENVKKLKLEKDILFLGAKTNPYPYIKKSDALLFSSIFEGYGLVLDEARILKTPFISTNVADAEKIAKEGYGFVCENSDEGMYAGMKEFLDKGYNLEEDFNYEVFNNNISVKLEELLSEE